MKKYDLEMETDLNTIPGKIMNRIRKESVVLEFGCAYGRMTKYLKEELQCQVYIVELDAIAYAHAVQYAVDGYCGDIETEEWYSLFADCSFDYILFADVLEHLKRPERILSVVKDLLKPDGEVLISLPNIAHFDVLANLYLNHFQYTKVGLLDNTHVHFWGREDLDRFASGAGYQIIQVDGVYVAPYATEQHVARKDISEAVERILQQKELKDLYQFFLVLKKSEEVSGDEIINDKLRYFYSYTQAAVYFDFGNGYEEEHSIRLSPTRKRSGEELVFEIQNLPYGCKKIRFDPAYGCFSVINDLKVVGNNGAYTGVPLNGAIIGSAIVFATTTPRIEIELREETQWLKITAFMAFTNDVRWVELLTELQAISEKNETISSLNDTVKQYEEMSSCQTEMLKKNKEELENKETELRDCKKAISNSESTLQQLRAYAESLEKDLDILRNDFEKLNETDAIRERELDELRARFHDVICLESEDGPSKNEGDFFSFEQKLLGAYEEQRRDLDRLTDELNHMTAYARHVEDLYHQLALQYNTVLSSRCWRMTAPLRHFLDFLKDKLKLRLAYKALSYMKYYGIRATFLKVRNYLNKERKVRFELPDKVENFAKLTEQLKKEGKKENVKLYLPEVLKDYDKKNGKKILLVSHDLNLTGAPIAIYYFAQVLKQNGYCPVILSPRDGSLAKIISEFGIPVIVSPGALNTSFVSSFAALFQLIILNTIVTAPILNQIDGMGLPVFWWIHEAEVSYTSEHLDQMPQILMDDVTVYAGGGYAKKILEKFRPEYHADEMLYYVPDKVQNTSKTYKLPEAAVGKVVFCIIGMLEARKGQNILADAILQLSEQVRQQSYFVFVGRQCFPPNYQRVLELCQKYPEHVCYIEELDVDEIQTLYRSMDCLICASLDDPMPIVVTEALEYGKLVICSEYTGSAELLTKEHSGLVYQNNDAGKLAMCIAHVVEHGKEMDATREAARRTYEKYFSRKVFEKNVISIVEQLCSDAQDGELLSITGKSLMMETLLETFQKSCVEGDCVYGEDTLLSYDKYPDRKRVLLLTHECSLSGAPIALQHLAETFCQNGAQVVIISPFDGPICEEFSKNHLPTFIYQNIYEDEFLRRQAEKFDLIVLSTVVSYRAIAQLKNCDTPVLWWIHDSKASYEVGGFGSCLPEDVPENVHVYCGGEYARDQLLTFYPNYTADILYYVSPDQYEKSKDYAAYPMNRKKGQMIFTIIGQQDIRKGHDILAKAIQFLTDEEREKAQFYFIGAHLDQEVQQAVDEACETYPECVKYIPQVNRQELFSVYRQSDCIVCSSRDDPMPIFVTESLMMSKTVICSAHTGWSPILEREACGLVYDGDAPESLAEKIRYVLLHNQELQSMRERGREIYLKYFSESAFETKSKEIMRSIMREAMNGEFRGTVSVIIPTYNPGAQLETLLQRLKTQRRIRRIEIIIIDSGSTDGTELLSKQYGAYFFPIPHENFTHSYARNKGASQATGELLLFMTQDALPVNEDWMYHLAEPILSGQAVAVSCMEQCPEDTDLYYKAASWNHAKYQGVLEGSRISRFSENDSVDDLRAKSSLNDVTSMIRTDVFLRFLYRYGYAEDLDMGLRLLRAGYSIGLLNTTASVHGHNRPAGYYMKRGFVEAKYLGKICELWKTPIESPGSIARQIVYSNYLLDEAAAKTREMIKTNIPIEEFFGVLLENLKDSISCLGETGTVCNVNRDPLLQWCIDVLIPWSTGADPKQENLVHHIAYYLEHLLHPYMEKNGVAILDCKYQELVYSCIEKQFALSVGTLLAGVDETSPLYEEIKNLAAGV